MRVPDLSRFSRWSFALGWFVLGAVAGASVLMAVVQRVHDIHVEENRILRIEKQILAENLASRAEYGHEPRAIHSIIVHLEDDGRTELDETARIELKRRVRDDLKVLLGKDINDITPLVDNGTRVLKTLYERLHSDVNGKDYFVRIDSYVIIYGELRVWASAREFVRL